MNSNYLIKLKQDYFDKRFLRSLEIFKKLDKNKYFIWSDAGQHFRCSEFIYYLFKSLKDEKIQVSYNIFAECHGKSSRDQHFSRISFFIKEAMFNKKLKSTNDVIAAIESGQIKSNATRCEKQLGPIKTLALEHRPELTIKDRFKNLRKILNLRTYYNFHSDKNLTMCSNIYTDLSEKFLIRYKDMITPRKNDEIKGKNKAELVVEDVDMELESLISKRKIITNVLTKNVKFNELDYY